jgi:glycosyltransferase involved in cell wall biosynthesis
MILVHVTSAAETFWFFEGQLDYLRERGFEVHAVSSPEKLLDDFAAEAKIPVHGIPMARRISPLADLVTLFRLYRLFRRLKPAIVHAHTPKGGLLGVIAARLARVPVVFYSIFGLPFTTAVGLKRKLLCWSETVSCSLAHQVIAIGFSVRDRVLAAGFCPENKIGVLAHGSFFGVDAEHRFNPAILPPGTRQEIRKRCRIPEEAVVIGYVGRIVRDKGIVELGEAWSLLRHTQDNLYLMLLGREEPQDPVPTEVLQQLKADPRVCFAGFVRDAAPYMTAMDLLAMPTYREGFNSAILEAAAMQMASVATKVDGCVESVADGLTGILVPPRDGQALAGALRRLLADPQLRNQMGLAGRQRVLELFRPELSWQALYRCYSDSLAAKAMKLPVTFPGQSLRDFSARGCER